MRSFRECDPSTCLVNDRRTRHHWDVAIATFPTPDAQMPPSEPAQMDLTRRYARELRRLHAEGRLAFRRNALAVKQAGQLAAEEPTRAQRPATAEVRQPEVVTPGVGHA